MAKRPKTYGRRWQTVATLGEGGQAHTYLVKDLHGGPEKWVLKRLRNKERRLGRFKQEISALARLSSRHIPIVVDHSLDDPPFLVTPYVGTDLTKLVESDLTLSRLLQRYRQVVTAAQDAHSIGLVHRDIKPNNVVVSAEGTAFLVDFGICADAGLGVVLTTTAEGFGNQAFAAPECAPGSLDRATPASDVYSLGKLLYWMTSDHKFMVRERFDLGSLNVVEKHARHYIARLIEATVREEPTSRWTTTELLEGIDWVLAKLEEHSKLDSRGVLVLWDGFGPDHERNRSGSRSAVGPPAGSHPPEHQLAQAFVTGRQSARLKLIELALRFHGATQQAIVALATDENGRPSGRVLEQWTIQRSNSRQDEVFCLQSTDQAVLEPACTYWLCVSANEAGSQVAWISASNNLVRSSRFAERNVPEEWEVRETRAGFALRVLAHGC